MNVKRDSSGIHFPLCIPLITQDFLPIVTGVSVVVFSLSKKLEEHGVSAPVLTTTIEIDKDVQTSGINVKRFQPVITYSNFRPSLALNKYLRRCPASLLHINGWRNPVSDYSMRIAVNRHIPFILQSHGMAFGYRYSNEKILVKLLRKLYEPAIQRYVTQTAAAVIATTQQEAQELQDYGFPKSRIFIIPYGISDAFFADSNHSYQRDNDGIVLLTVARIAPRRNLEQIIQAVAQLRSQAINVRLRVVGPEVKLASGEKTGYQRYLENLSMETGIGNAITFVGPRHGAELLNEYLSADIFVYTTLYENFGIPIGEAAATGLPIVATPTGIAIDFLQDGVSGILVPFRDSDATTVALRTLCLDSSLRTRLGQNAKRQALTELKWETVVLRYLELYISVLNFF